MLMKRTREYVDDSWEERAFAEDAAGMLGGCVWPPRSYTCNFCSREFRSAQALGGHMNVHRRDRARLKQFPCPPNDQFTSLTFTYPTHPKQDNYSLLYGNPDFPDSNNLPTVSTSIPHKISTLVSQEVNGTKQTFTSHFPSSFVLNHKNKELGRLNGEDKVVDGITDVAVDEEEVPNNHKRRKIDHVPSQQNGKDKVVVNIISKVHELQSTSLEELDLELRLGDRPKVR